MTPSKCPVHGERRPERLHAGGPPWLMTNSWALGLRTEHPGSKNTVLHTALLTVYHSCHSTVGPVYFGTLTSYRTNTTSFQMSVCGQRQPIISKGCNVGDPFSPVQGDSPGGQSLIILDEADSHDPLCQPMVQW